ncbi:sigma-70 family RNA polymerase sigma factor [Zobellia amurskyensis]|uniref:Sigma-70 family RNA polymerase sigma factor n=1 Tax=Zobellia amurskyensis TaxID=248905 RepID=A0A7X2ZQD3_9FLAO|nr:sigma-70 family RNA polymerase sigma factor [Zobellia amurskyensis]MUH34457.1 sigma-70 family RNA polymerase sigma factor [Zobellia amurskyensis]
MSISSEKPLWQLFIEGDKNAFSSLFKTYYSQLYNYGIKISSDQFVTEDCLQSFFLYLHKNRKNLGEVNNVKSYLFISFRRVVLKSLKKERQFSSYEETIESNQSFGFSPEELKIEQEISNTKTTTLVILLNSLSARQREVVYLKYYSELSIKDTAEVMDISYQSVLNTLQKAFSKLRSEILDHEISAVLQKTSKK